MVYCYWFLTAMLSYLLGCFNGSILVSKYVFHNDVRAHGSGNAGLTNFYRTFGGPWTFMVVLGDVVKVVIAIFLCRWIMAPFGSAAVVQVSYWSNLFVMLGHVFPAFFRFRGGKGVLSAGTAVAILDWRVFCLVMGLFLLGVACTRWVSLGSILAGITFPFGVWLIAKADLFSIICSALCGVLLLIMHRQNIVRLFKGEERKFQFSKSEGSVK
jgi:glycerol-3-phosphate acyltransferase PlsY